MSAGTGRFGNAPTTYTSWPRVTVTLPDEGKVTGAFTVTFTNGEHASALTDGAHVNDDNQAVEYRGASYLAHVHVYRGADGTWRAGDKYPPHVTRRENWSDAPRTYRDAIANAIAEAVDAVASVSPEIIRAGEYSDASNMARDLASKLAELDIERAAVRKSLKSALARMEASKPLI